MAYGTSVTVYLFPVPVPFGKTSSDWPMTHLDTLAQTNRTRHCTMLITGQTCAGTLKKHTSPHVQTVCATNPRCKDQQVLYIHSQYPTTMATVSRLISSDPSPSTKALIVFYP